MNKSTLRYHKVVVIISNCKKFRKPFYEQLRDLLKVSNIEIEVYYSDSRPEIALRRDDYDLPPPLGQKVGRIYLMGGRILFQFVPLTAIINADLIIVVQATGILINYPLLILSALGIKRVAFWGHGRNHQGSENSISERIKRCLANATNWWFSYTEETKAYLISIGVSANKITAINNAIDTTGFRKTVQSVTTDELRNMRLRLGVEEGDPVALYCGALYKEKRLTYLLDSVAQIATVFPRFRLIIVGDGPDAGIVKKYSSVNGNVCYLGPMFGKDKAICFRMSQLFLCPGLVGLGILDSFAAGLPLITTNDGLHSPEIAYLVHGENGLMLCGDQNDYAKGVVELIRDPLRIKEFSKNAEAAALRYSLENMVSNVCSGIHRALGLSTEVSVNQ